MTGQGLLAAYQYAIKRWNEIRRWKKGEPIKIQESIYFWITFCVSGKDKYRY